MARPRKYIRDAQGKEVPGLSLHRPSNRYYSVSESGDRVYWGRDKDKAIDGYCGTDPLWNLPEVPIDGVVIKHTRAEIRKENQIRDKLYKDHIDEEEEIKSKRRLRDCLKVWMEWNGSLTTAIDTQRIYKSFVTTVGNCSIGELSFDHFQKWQKWVTKTKAQRKWSVKSYKDHHATVSKVLIYAKRKEKTWVFPDGLVEWVSDWKLDNQPKYVPALKNSEPIPIAVYHKQLKACRKDQQIDPTKSSPHTQKGRGKRKQAQLKLWHGFQFEALLKLALNCGLSSIDICRIEWSNLHLTGKLPFMDFARSKTEHKTGYAVPRSTPLLKSTVKSLKTWKEKEKTRRGYVPTGLVFRCGSYGPWNSQTLSKAFGRFDAGEWTLKHYRNVGSTIGFRNGISPDLVDRFLGQTVKEVRGYYTATHTTGAEALLPLVKLIDKEYKVK